MGQVFRFIRSLYTKKQLTLFILVIIAPLIFSLSLYITSDIFNLELFGNPQAKFYILLMGIISCIFFSIIYLSFSINFTHNKEFKTNRTIIANSIRNLSNIRMSNRIDFLIFLAFIIILFYYLTLIPFIIEYNKDDIVNLIIMIIPLLIIFMIFFTHLINIFNGLREKSFYIYFLPFWVLFGWIIFLFMNSVLAKYAATRSFLRWQRLKLPRACPASSKLPASFFALTSSG